MTDKWMNRAAGCLAGLGLGLLLTAANCDGTRIQEEQDIEDMGGLPAWVNEPNPLCFPPDNGVTRPYGTLVVRASEDVKLAADAAGLDEVETCVDVRYQTDTYECLEDSGPWQHFPYGLTCYAFYPISTYAVEKNSVYGAWEGAGDTPKCRRMMKDACLAQLRQWCTAYDPTYDGVAEVEYETIYNTHYVDDQLRDRVTCLNTCSGRCYRR